MKFITQILVSALAVMFVQWLLPGVSVDGFMVGIIVALALAFFNALVKPVLIFLTLPATIITLGLFLLVINAVIILLADWLVSGFSVSGFWSAMFFSIILSFVTSIFNSLAGTDK